MRTSTPERFWNSVDRTGDCWEWQGSRVPKGYGASTWQGERDSTHRIAWTIANGPIPEGMQVLHHCDNPPCCNPTHLFLGTNADNVADRISKGRGNVPRGERNPSAKLTQSRVDNIRATFAQGTHSISQLAREAGISRPHLSRILRHELW